MKYFYYLTVSIILIFSLAAQPSNAENQPAADSESAQSNETTRALDDFSISDGKKLGKWWSISAKKYDPMPKPLLYHFEGTYSFAETGGNVDYKSNTANAKLTLRKNIFTSTTEYNLSKSETILSLLPSVVTEVESNIFGQTLTASLTDRIDAIGGFMWQKSSAKYIQDRTVLYAGLSGYLFEYPNFKMQVAGCYGAVDTTYMNDYLGTMGFTGLDPVESYDSGSLYFFQNMNWQITDSISLSDTFYYIYFLEDSKYYNWKADLALNFKVTETISLSTTYSIEYDKNSFVEGMNEQLTTGEIDEKNTGLSFGVKIAL